MTILLDAGERALPDATPRRSAYPGKLIAVEGLDGSGKSTQIYLLKRWFELQNMKVSFTEWNSATIVKAARIPYNVPTAVRLVGKLDATADRKAGVLRVNAIHGDVRFSPAMTKAVRKEIDGLAAWLSLALR